MQSEKVVSYFYDEELGLYSYGEANPMRPHRLRLTHNLVSSYGLTKKLHVHRPRPRGVSDMTEFHADDYVSFLKQVTPNNKSEFMTQLRRFNVGLQGEADCPVFDGLFEYCQVFPRRFSPTHWFVCQLYTGGSVDGASLLNSKKTDVCLNWAGGMHHAKKAEASGFCYINDIVLAILELLKCHHRVLYVDIDIHHGDGVEEAFYATDRVLTVSFHKHGDFFPGTGELGDIGYERGKYYALNVPLKEGMDDDSYKFIFEPIISKVLEVYQPNAIVVCAGADSLAGDRIGCFNLSLEGHSNCLEFLSKYNVPMLVLGGGGYTLRNVSRCWTYETARLMGCEVPDDIPEDGLAAYNYYMDTGKLRIQTSNMRNANTREDLEDIKIKCLQNLHKLGAPPGASIEEVPPLHAVDQEVEMNIDERGGGPAAMEQIITDDLSDNEEDNVNTVSSPAYKRIKIDQSFQQNEDQEMIPSQAQDDQMQDDYTPDVVGQSDDNRPLM